MGLKKIRRCPNASSDDREDGQPKGNVFGRLGTQSLSSSLVDIRQRLGPKLPSLPQISAFERLGTRKTAATASLRTDQSPISVHGSPIGGFSSSSGSESVRSTVCSVTGLGRGILSHEAKEQQRSIHQTIHGPSYGVPSLHRGRGFSPAPTPRVRHLLDEGFSFGRGYLLVQQRVQLLAIKLLERETKRWRQKTARVAEKVVENIPRASFDR